ncbi:MAG TPA: glucosaminidase domain-containing protein [Chitinophagaceae bacterium]|nr:glucosaminidase domain-containing protein [Chitinophagaceae bacterium]
MIRSAIACLLLIATLCTQAQPRAGVIEYINTYKALAISEMQRTGIPAAIKLAQGIHETDAGNSELVRKSNNHFGIKCKSTWTGDKVYHDDDARGECFRKYGSPQDSYMDHSNFLKGSPRYASLFELDPTDFEGWAYGLKKAGYATNVKYSQILIRIINEYHLQDYTLIALGKMKPEDEWLASAGKIMLPEQVKMEATTEVVEKAMEVEQPKVNYPEGEFRINDTRVVYAKAGTSLLSIAEEYGVSLKRIMEFNELNEENILKKGQLVYLQRKRKSSHNEFHVVQPGETLYDISQSEGLRMESLLAYNLLHKGMQPAEGEKLYLKYEAPVRPALASELSRTVAQVNTAGINMPVENTYTKHVVQTKETLFAISKKYGVPVEKLMQWNNLANYDLRTGQELIIYKN